MRLKERIPIVLDNINWFDFIYYLGFNNPKDIADKCEENINLIKSEWELEPDLRLTQVLVICGIIENLPGSWFYVEEVDYMLENNVVEPEEILFWGTRGKDGRQPLKRIAIKDMESEHIEACLKTQKHMNPLYRSSMEKVLRRRKLNSIKNKEK